MNPTQSIIVYRNPMEQQIWESGIVPPLMISMVVFFIVLLAIMKIVELVSKIMKRRFNNNWVSYSAMALSTIAAFSVFNHLT